MSLIKIRAALETQLGTITPALATAWENMPFVPVDGIPYQKVIMLPAETLSPTLGDSYHRESGIFQVTLCYPVLASAGASQGSAGAMAQAEAIRAAFLRGMAFSTGGIAVQIERHPSVAPAIIAGDRYCLPVRVRYFAHIYN